MGKLLRAAMLPVLLAAGCGGGTKPNVGTLLPQAICTGAAGAAVAISGTGFAPVLKGGLAGDPSLVAPQVTLTRTQILTGTGDAGATSFSIDGSKVVWTSEGALSVDLSGSVATPGLYDVDIENGNGHSTHVPDALLIVPPPETSQATPLLVTQEDGGPLVITGNFFINAQSALPVVQLTAPDKDTVVLDQVTLDSCQPLPGSSGLQTCQQLTVQIPANGVVLGNYALEIDNPAPVGCNSTAQITRAGGALPLTVVPRPKLTAVVTDFVCTNDAAVNVTVQGSGFVTNDPTFPILRLGTTAIPTTGSDCVEIPLETQFVPRVAPLMSCTTMTANIPAAGVPAGLLATSVENPFGGGKSIDPISFYSAPSPSITTLDGNYVCAAGSKGELKITGTGFFSVDGVLPSVMVGTQQLVSVGKNCKQIAGFRAGVLSCPEIDINVPKTGLVGGFPVSVVNQPNIGCVSKELLQLVNIDAPTVSTIAPLRVCTTAASSVTINGTGFLDTGSTQPTVVLSGSGGTLNTTTKQCAPIANGPVTGLLCTQLKVSIPASAAAVNLGGYTLKVVNPPPADCAANVSGKLLVFPPPTIASAVVSSALAGASIIAITGTGFAPGAKIAVNGLLSSGGSVLSPTSAVAVVSADPTQPGNVTGVITIDNGDGCGVQASVQISPPVAPFAAPAGAALGSLVSNNMTSPLLLQGLSANTASVQARSASVNLALPMGKGSDGDTVVLVPKGLDAGNYALISVDDQGQENSLRSFEVVAGLVESATLRVQWSQVADGTLRISVKGAPPPDGSIGWLYREDDPTAVAIPATMLGGKTFSVSTVGMGSGLYGFVALTPEGNTVRLLASTATLSYPVAGSGGAADDEVTLGGGN